MQIYKVGGWVRDYLLGLSPSDCDYVVVGSSVKEMLLLGFKPVGRDFPVFLHPITHEEYALARTERKTSFGYHGFEFYAEPDVSLVDDLYRRDLTINAIAMDDYGELIDPFGGKLDLERKLIRHVSNAFSEDPLRVLRAARFCAQLNFTITISTMRLMRHISGELVHISKERISIEIHKGLNAKYPTKFLKALHIANSLHIISPELAKFWRERQFREKLCRLLNSVYDIHERMAILHYMLSNSKELSVLLHSETKDIAQLLIRNYNTIMNFRSLTAEDILNLINKLDERRKPQRYQIFLRLCELIAENDAVIQQNLLALDKILKKLKQLNWEDVCVNIFSVQNKIIYFRGEQIKLIEKNNIIFV